MILFLSHAIFSKYSTINLYSSFTFKFVKYSFDPSTIVEMRQTYVEHEGEWLDAVVCTFTDNNFETPPLIVHYNEFKRMLNEYNKKNTKA